MQADGRECDSIGQIGRFNLFVRQKLIPEIKLIDWSFNRNIEEKKHLGLKVSSTQILRVSY